MHHSDQLALPALQVQEQLLALKPARVAAEATRRVERPVAGDDDRQRVRAERVAGGAEAARASGVGRDSLVSRHRPERNPGGGLEHAAPETVRELPVERDFKLAAGGREVLVELA